MKKYRIARNDYHYVIQEWSWVFPFWSKVGLETGFYLSKDEAVEYMEELKGDLKKSSKYIPV